MNSLNFPPPIMSLFQVESPAVPSSETSPSAINKDMFHTLEIKKKANDPKKLRALNAMLPRVQASDFLGNVEEQELKNLLNLCYPPPVKMEFSTYRNLISKASCDQEFILEALYPEESYIALQNEFREHLADRDFKHPEWEKHIVRKDSFATRIDYTHSNKQERYGSLIATTIDLLSGYKDNSFKFILHFCCYARFAIENRCVENPQTNQIGPSYEYGLLAFRPFTVKSWVSKALKIRNPNSYFCTPLSGPYSDLSKNLERHLLTQSIDHLPIIVSDGSLYNLIGHIKEKAIPLSTFELSNEPKVLHTYPKFVPEILDYAEELYEEAMQKNDRQIIIDLGAQIYWWLCQAKFVARGDPSIAEMIICVLFKAKGINFPGWKKGVVPWESTCLCFTPEKFVDQFQELLESPL